MKTEYGSYIIQKKTYNRKIEYFAYVMEEAKDEIKNENTQRYSPH